MGIIPSRNEPFSAFWTFKNYEVMISVERYFSYLSTGIVSYFFVATCLVRNCLKKVGRLLVDPGLLTHLQLSLCRNLRSNFQLIVKNLLQICNSYRKGSLQFIEKPVSFLFLLLCLVSWWLRLCDNQTKSRYGDANWEISEWLLCGRRDYKLGMPDSSSSSSGSNAVIWKSICVPSFYVRWIFFTNCTKWLRIFILTLSLENYQALLWLYMKPKKNRAQSGSYFAKFF